MQLKQRIPILGRQFCQIHAQVIVNPTAHLLNPLLGIVTHSSTPKCALLLYNQMLQQPSSYNHYTFTYALKACSLLQVREKGLEIHACVIKSGHYSDLYIQNSLLHFYVETKDIHSALQVFEFISCPDVVSWTSIISGFSKFGLGVEAIRKFFMMDVKPNSATFVSVLSAFSMVKALSLGEAIHAYSLRNFDRNPVMLDNAILDMYVKCGFLEKAERLFVYMSSKDVISWTTMVDGYAKKGLSGNAVNLFKTMIIRGETDPNEATLIALLSACSSVGALNLGQWVHSYIDARSDLLVEGNLGNALVNMYIKSGDVNTAIQVFNTITEKDVICWDTVICGLAMNGHGKCALELFSLMIVQGFPPDDVTFIGLLSACSNSGLVNQGLIFFKAMRHAYGIVPQMRHYGCMVDMYGRAGLLEEAEEFMKGMPVVPEAPMWGSLIQACKDYGTEKMFERIELEINERSVGPGTLALLSNAYASTGKWDDANRIRDALKVGGLKMSGCSWIGLV